MDLFSQDLVVNKKSRPRIPEPWETASTSCPGFPDLVATIRDCWDQDAEARLSASNVKERVRAMKHEVNARNNATQQQPHNNDVNILNQMNSAGGAGTLDQQEMTPLIMPQNGVPNPNV